MDRTQYREYIVRPILKSIALWSEAAEHLIVGTTEIESAFQYIKQIGGGPAVSFLQIEPFTYRDLRKRVMGDYSKIAERITTALYLDYLPEDSSYLIGNIGAAVAFARLKYFFDPEPLPDAKDYENLAKYYKRVYNTSIGATTLEKATKIFRSVVLNYTDTLSQRC